RRRHTRFKCDWSSDVCSSDLLPGRGAAVLAALDAGRLHAYVCDFPSRLLKEHPRVMTLPHLGASTGEAEENCAVMVAEQLRDFRSEERRVGKEVRAGSAPDDE